MQKLLCVIVEHLFLCSIGKVRRVNTCKILDKDFFATKGRISAKEHMVGTKKSIATKQAGYISM